MFIFCCVSIPFCCASEFAICSSVDVDNASAKATTPTTAAAIPVAIKKIGLTSKDAVHAIVAVVAAYAPPANARNDGDDARAAIPTAARPIAIGAR